MSRTIKAAIAHFNDGVTPAAGLRHPHGIAHYWANIQHARLTYSPSIRHNIAHYCNLIFDTIGKLIRLQ